MEDKIAIIGIFIQDHTMSGKVNELLHEYAPYIIGRMGIPYPKRNISLISVAMDAPADAISAMTGKIGMLDGITSKAVYSKVPAPLE